MNIKKFFRCGVMGWCLEILWTGFQSFRLRRLKLMGNSSLWMFPIYGCAAFLTPLMRRIKERSIWFRGFFYMIFIFLGEFVSGRFLKKRGICPWDYSSSPYHIQGIIRLDYAPLWFLVGLFYERVLTAKK